ncbi:hypothetical protein [Legionella sp. km772]|uniref:hypothetical protein n=1 Tax=Legionella sp. km772 TaxID=2498111 RepID=UPI000F8D74B3|nr:hypothetical protein [Legionella sp. km772]RUR08482.1 hypothetical protein ELY15_10725 [Legionella sp. km772]
MKDKLDLDPKATKTASISTYTILKFIYKLIKNQPSKIFTFTRMWATGSTQLTADLGKELVEVLKDLKPNFRAIVDVLLASNHATNLDDLYETIKPLLDNLLNKNIGNYGVNLKELDVDKLLTESYIKSDLLPIFLTLRDIPKFCKSIKEKNFLKIIQDTRTQLLTHLETDLHSEIRKHLLVGRDGLYEMKPEDPALVSQIKKILNAFVYAEKVITFVNSLDLNPDTGFKFEALLDNKGENQVEFLTKVTWYLAMKDSVIGNYLSFTLDLEPDELHFIHEIEKTITYVRKAQSSLLEVDLPTYQIFETELKSLDDLIVFLQKMTNGDAKAIWENKLSNIDVLAKAAGDLVGKPLGSFIDELKPRPGTRNLSVLTSHLGLLPGYLDEVTQLIYSYGAGQPEKELALSEADKEVHKNAAIKLFFELSNFDSLFFWQKASAALFPIRKDIVTLSQGTFQQITRTNEALGEMVAHQLSRVKTELCTKIIAESDKLELYLGLAPGVLTKPLMLRLNGLYQHLVFHANYIIDLKEKYPDLLQLDNTSFLTKRLQNTLQQKNDCQLKLDRAMRAKQDLLLFIEQFVKAKTKEEKLILNTLYNSFKLYVIDYNPRLSVLLDKYLTEDASASDALNLSEEELGLMSKSVQGLCDKELATFGCFLKLADSHLTELPKQIKGKLYPLDSEKQHSLLYINEPDWLADNKILTKEANTPLKKGYRFVDNLSALTVESRADLYDYHSIRVLTLRHIQQEIELFLQQLSVADWSLNPKSVNQILERYRVLQPYLVDALATTDSEIDNSFVDLLNQLLNDVEKPKKLVVVLDSMNARMNELKRQFAIEISASESRRMLFETAHLSIREKKSLLFNNEPLSLKSELVQRQDKWIRHQQLSRASTDMKNVLLKLLTQFDPSLKLSAAKANSHAVVPFPEMEDDLEALTVPSQVSWAKRMLNVVHYINSNFKYLESLDRDIHKKDITHYFLKGPLIEGLYQIKPFLELAKAYQTLMELMQEPTGQVLFDSVKSSYENLMAVWETVKPLYFVSSEQVQSAKPKAVKSSGLWYPVLSLMVLPEHLEHLSSGQSYTSHHAELAQKNAKEVAQYIEQISDEFQAGQYFYLLLKSPYVIFKFLPQLKSKIDKLCEDTNEITTAHLQDIQTVLYSLLVETDALELKLGLRVGLISQPTKLILDKFFTRFIEPLSISFQKSAQLVQDLSSFQSRLQINRQKQTETMQMLDSEKNSLLSLDEFLKVLKVIKAKLDTKELISPIEKEAFKKLYWSIYPVLQAQHSHYQISLNQKDKSINLDKFCDECFSEQLKEVRVDNKVYHFNSLKDVMYLTTHVHAAKKGNINSLEMRAAYLNAQAQSLINAKQHFIKVESRAALDNCIKYTINGQIELICKKTNQLVYLEQEYKHILLKALLSQKEEIFAKVANLPVKEIEKAISTELQKQFHLFGQTQYQQLLQLDSILAEIERFQLYCQKEKFKPIYENTDPTSGTLTPKIALLNRLKTLAQNDQLPIEQRIAQLADEARKDSFYTILMSHDSHFKFELKAIKRMFLNLFHSIFNFFGMTYHPEDFYTSLNKVLKPEGTSPTKSPLINTGFFSDLWQGKLFDEANEAELTSLDSPEKPSLS